MLSFNDAPNFEDPKDSGTDNTYVVTVQATSGTGTREMTASQTITVTVTDALEKSAKPDKPTLAKVTGSSTSLTATWTKPDLNGGPDITGYAVQYKVNTATTWEDFAHSDTAVTTTITGLTADTSYQVQVRAKNGETDSDWSDPSDAVRTSAVDMPIPPGLEVTLHLSADEPLENAGMDPGDGDGVARLARGLHGDGVGEPRGAGYRRRLQAELEPGAELRRGRDREHRGGEDRAG